jgi:hypothetical protein
LMMEALSSSEMSVLARGTRRNIPEDAIFQWISMFNKNPESYQTLYNSISTILYYIRLISKGHNRPRTD